MKKKIAMFATGWSGQIQYQYLSGLQAGLEQDSVDIYLFLSHAVFGASERETQGELNIYELPHMEDFDAAIIFANSLDFPKLLEKLNDRCNKAGIPVIYTGKEEKDFYFVGSDNYPGARDLAEHLISVHNVKKVWFIAGSPDNMDSNIRIRAVKDVLTSHDLELEDKDIIYTNWSPYIGYTTVLNRLDAGEALPDAIVCANDTLAMVLSSALLKRGIRVPEDLILTGFDNEFLAQIYDPSISSVDQRFDNIGRKCADMLHGLFNGLPVERVQKVACQFVPSESCGCCTAKDFNAIRRRVGRDKFDDQIYTSNFDIKLSSIERIILQGKDYSSLAENLKHLHSNSADYEGSTFHIAMDPLVEKTIQDQSRPLRKEGYPEYMDLVYSKDRDCVSGSAEFPTRELVPRIAGDSSNRFFVFLPLHESEFSTGYMVFGDDMEKIKNSQLLRRYAERLNIIFSRFYQRLRLDALNQRLLQMTETDALTHVKNRTAFVSRQGTLQSKMQSDPKPTFAMIVFDINNLKTINDRLGHEAGDEYIVNSCRLICKTFKKSAVYRIGGDEFVVVLENDDYENREILLYEMQQEMRSLQASSLPIYEKLSIACGMADYCPETDFNISDVFHRADETMYRNKAEMKNQNNEESCQA